MDIKDVKSIHLSDEQYEQMVDVIKKNGGEVPENEIAFVVKINDGDPVIVFREKFNTLSSLSKRIIAAHELAHCLGIEDEEEADRWALDALTTYEERVFLIDQWKYRHGHKYYESDI